MMINVLGAGSWGTALALLLGRNGHEVTLFGRDSEEMPILSRLRENIHYLPGFVLPESVRIVWTPDELATPDFWVFAVPSHAVAEMAALAGRVQADPSVLIASKGLDARGPQLLGQTVGQAIPDARIGVISGPNLAVEIARGIPTAAVCAFEDLEIADRIRAAFMCRTFRVYTSTDIIGIELAGALKNVMAIAAGVSDGLGYGDNTKGALLARGLGEMSKLGLAMGGKLSTFLGIAGVGDLFATAASTLSRNYRVGRCLGEGMSLTEALAGIGQVAEGVSTSESAMVLARRNSLALPTFEAVDNALRGRVKPAEAVSLLMERTPREEA